MMDKPRIVYQNFMAQRKIDEALRLWGSRGLLAVADHLVEGQPADVRAAVLRHTTEPYDPKILSSVSGRTYVVASMLADRAGVLGHFDIKFFFEKMANLYGGAVGVAQSVPSPASTMVIDERDFGFGFHG